MHIPVYRFCRSENKLELKEAYRHTEVARLHETKDARRIVGLYSSCCEVPRTFALFIGDNFRVVGIITLSAGCNVTETLKRLGQGAAILEPHGIITGQCSPDPSMSLFEHVQNMCAILNVPLFDHFFCTNGELISVRADQPSETVLSCVSPTRTTNSTCN